MLIEIKEQAKASYAQQWFEYKDGVKFLIASSGKPAFNRALELNNMQAEQELRGAKQVTDESAEHAKLAFNRSVSHLILAWSGIESESNKPFEYSIKNAELLCTSTSEAHEIVNFVVERAVELEQERNRELADTVGKSLSTTNTATSNGRREKPVKSTKD